MHKGAPIIVAGHRGMARSVNTRTRDEPDLLTLRTVERIFHGQQPHHIFVAPPRVGVVQASDQYRSDSLCRTFFRPTEVGTPPGDPTKAKDKLGRTPRNSPEQLAQEMVEPAWHKRLFKSAGFQAIDRFD